MARNLARTFEAVLMQVEQIMFSSFGTRPPVELIPVALQTSELSRNKETFNLKSIFDGFLWGVPTCRRTAEKRMMRKYGAANWHNKLILPRKDLKVCGSCGHYHEENRLCPNCYAKVKAETTLMQEKIVQELGYNPIEQEVAVVYQGEREQSEQQIKGKKIIEMDKPRPKWFSKNLLQKSGPVTELGNSDAVSVKPHELS